MLNYELLKDISGMPDCAVSFKIPVKRGEFVLDAVFLYDSLPKVEKSRPFALAVTDPDTDCLLEYHNAFINDFVDPEKYPMDQDIDYSVPMAKTAMEQKALVDKVNALYEQVRGIAFKDDLTKDEEAMLAEYCRLFYRTVPAGLIPFYDAASPEFAKRLNNYR